MKSSIYPKSDIAAIALVAIAFAGNSLAQDSAGDASAAQEDADDLELVIIDGTRSSDEVGVLNYEDEDLDTDYEEPKTERETDEEEVRRYFELYKESLANKQYDEADSLAKRLVELSIKTYGLDSHESARALTNLGIVQYRNKDFESSQLNYQAAIDIIERIEDRLNGMLVNPLKGLGASQLAGGRPDLALQTFGRAVHVSHVNEGPHNLDQVEILDALTETHLSVGDVDEALDMQEHVYNLQTRKIDMNSEAVIPALERQAEWMHRLNYYNRERNAWRKLIRVLEGEHGKEDLSLVRPLTGLGRSYLFFDVLESEFQAYSPASSGETYLKRALRIAEENPDSTWQINEQALLALGDYYTMSGRPNRAKRAYLDTWNLLSAEQDRLRNRFEELETIKRLQDISPPKYYNSELTDENGPPPDSFEVGTVVVGFSVSPFGATTNLKIIESNPQGVIDMERAVARDVRRLIHRPRMADGNNVQTDDLTYAHEYFYRPSDLVDPDAEVTEFTADQDSQ
jgi:hypothetical protein